MLICPYCRSPLDVRATLRCACGREYPRLPSGGVDFLEGRGFADFEIDPADAEQRRTLEAEAAGVAWRMESLVLPLAGRYLRCVGGRGRPVTILDCGCGSGISVDVLRARGFDAWGIDAGRARHRQWRERNSAAWLHAADALQLPFGDSAFDIVISSGLMEHIGIHEEESNGYRAHRLPDCHERRRRFVAELVRVLGHDGFILLDHPNGAFPIDFWHGGRAGGLRWHRTRGDMLPRFDEVARYFGEVDPSLGLFPLSPARRLRLAQVRRHWYGRMLAPLAALWLHLLDRRSLSFMARSPLNPYLVTVATRRGDAPAWIYP